MAIETVVLSRNTRRGVLQQLLALEVDRDVSIATERDSISGLLVPVNPIVAVQFRNDDPAAMDFNLSTLLRGSQQDLKRLAHKGASRVLLPPNVPYWGLAHGSVYPKPVTGPPRSVAWGSTLTSNGDATPTSSFITGVHTPTANSLVQIWLAIVLGTAQTFSSITDTYLDSGGGAWTLVAVQQIDDGGILSSMRLYRRQIGTGPVAGTVTVTFSGNIDRKSWGVAEVSGHDTTTPVSESVIDNNALTSLAVSIAGIAAGNLAHGSIISQGAASITHDPDFSTAQTEVSSGSTFQARQEMQVNADTEITMTSTGLNTARNIALLVEWAAAAGAAVARRRASFSGGGRTGGF